MNLKALFIATLFGAAASVALTSGASASPWSFHHPRLAAVNHRLAHQDMRIEKAYREGRISAFQARHLHRQVRMVRERERFDVRHHNGRLTAFEQRRLNRAENQVGWQIRRAS